MDIRRIGFVGIGHMGWPMAANLARAGFGLIIHDQRPDQVSAFQREHPCAIAGSLSELARSAECIITMLPDHAVVKRVVLGAGTDCIAAGFEPGHILVDMSTSDPTATQTLGAALSLRGVHVIDAPVMGGVAFARDGTLDIMAGGDVEAVDMLAPVFAALGRKVYHCGPLGSGHALKAINNYVNACTLINVIEGLALGRKFGIDTAMMVETMQAMCMGRNHPIEKKLVPHILTRKYASGMAIGFIAKDLRIAVESAHRVGAAVPLAEHVCELWNDAAKTLGPAVDQTEVVRYWEQASGVTL